VQGDMGRLVENGAAWEQAARPREAGVGPDALLGRAGGPEWAVCPSLRLEQTAARQIGYARHVSSVVCCMYSDLRLAGASGFSTFRLVPKRVCPSLLPLRMGSLKRASTPHACLCAVTGMAAGWRLA
jgi:hypothetical protein